MLALVAMIVVVPAAAGQDVVSAMAGFIYFAEGQVLLDGEPIEFNEAQLLHAGSGQRVRTADGWVELMLMPGSFLRLAPHSELEMIQAGMLSARMRLLAGAAAVDLAGAADTGEIVIEVAGAEVSFAKRGLYRIDAPVGGNATVRSIGGRAWVEWRGEKLKVGGERELTITASARNLKAGKPEKSEQDALDRWNRERRQLLAVRAREHVQGRGHGAGPLENSEIYRCRFMGRRCPATNFNATQASRLPLPLLIFQVGAR